MFANILKDACHHAQVEPQLDRNFDGRSLTSSANSSNETAWMLVCVIFGNVHFMT